MAIALRSAATGHTDSARTSLLSSLSGTNALVAEFFGAEDFAPAYACWGVFGPAKLPAGMAETLGNAIEKIVRSEALRGDLEPLGVLPSVLTGRAFADFQATESDKWGKAVRESGATAE